jgi:NAD(P)-dependent dehydrogenase (short-subunit alcohol dehydrogenase family)
VTFANRNVNRWRAFAVLAVAYFMTVLDLTIVNTALPTIGRDLHFSATNLQWVATAYGLTFGGFLLLGGRAADLLGRRRVLMAGLGVFAGASLACALATADGFLIGARAVQGIGAAVMLPASLAIVMNMFGEGAERNKAPRIWGALAASGATVGLVAGGLLTRYAGWQYIFYLNVPIAIVTLLLAPRTVPESRAFAVAGAGTAFAFIPISIAGLAGVQTHRAGLASGLLNTSQNLCGAIGIAIAQTSPPATPRRCCTPATRCRPRSPAATSTPSGRSARSRSSPCRRSSRSCAGTKSQTAHARPPSASRTPRSHQSADPPAPLTKPTTHNPKGDTTMSTTTAGRSVLITGANRGLGRALVDEALKRGARRVYAASRQPAAYADTRVTSLILDVTDPAQIHAAVEQIDSLDILINNAGVSVPDDLSDRSAFERHLAVNLYGTLDVTQALLPTLIRSQGAVVNIVSVGALAAVPVLPAYSVSKAASMSLTQSLRALLAGQGVSVQAVLPGPIDTDMVRDLPIPKAPPKSVAQGVFDGIETGEEEIFPDPMAAVLAEGWHAGVSKQLERQNATLVQPKTLAA